MLLSFLLFFPSPAAADAVGAFSDLMKNAKTFRVDVRARTTGNKDQGVGTFEFERPVRNRFQMKWGAAEYVYAQNERGLIEIDFGSRTYREFAPWSRPIMPDSTLSTIPETAFPLALLAGRLDVEIPQGTAFRAAQPKQGQDANETAMSASFSSGPARITVNTRIASDGRLMYYSTTTEGAGPPVTTELFFSGHQINKPSRPGAFFPKVPVGFSPQALPDTPIPVNVREKFPLTGLADWRSRKPEDLARRFGGKPLLLVIADASCAASGRALQALPELAKVVKGSGGSAAIVWTKRARHSKAPAGYPELFDATGDVLERLRLPGTPAIYLLDGKGVVLQFWIGYDPAIASNYRAELVERLRPKATQRARG